MVGKLLGVLSIVAAAQAMSPSPTGLVPITVTGDTAVKSTASYGDYVYTGYNSDIQVGIYSIQNPATPVLVKRFGTTNRPYKVEVVGSILYVRRSHSLDTYSLADPENPVLVSSHVTGCYSYTHGSADLAFSGDYLYIACPSVLIVLLTDASGTLTLVQNLNHGRSNIFPEDLVTVVGTKLFVIHVWYDISFFDISNPAAPVLQVIRNYGSSRFFDVTYNNGFLYVVGMYPTLSKIDINTGAMVTFNLPSEIANLDFSTAVDFESPYLYMGSLRSGGLFVLEEVAGNTINIVERLDVAGSRVHDVEVMDGQLFAASWKQNKWWIFESDTVCTASAGPKVVINGDELVGEDLAGATTYTNAQKQLERIPTNFRSMKVHMPEINVFVGSKIELVCCGTGAVCEFVLSHYHCPPCSGAVNGGFPKMLPVHGFEAGSCAPKYGATEERMTSYRVQVQPGETLTLDPITLDATSFAIFSQQGAFAEAWCPAREGKVGCGGPCPPNVCKCLN